MSPAILSLTALVIAIVVSMFAGVNVGFLSMALAVIVGFLGNGMHAEQVAKNFPADLFIILVGVSYLFSLAQVNGTLDRVTKVGLKMVKGNGAVLPFVFFALATVLSAIGPGAIPAIALLAAPAAAVAAEARIPYFLMGVCVMHGAISGTMSPIAPMGIVASKIVQPLVGDISVRLFLNTAAANIVIAVLAYFAFGGLKLIARFKEHPITLADVDEAKWETKQIVTLVGIAVLVIAAVGFKMHIGFTAITIAVCIAWLSKEDDIKAIKSIHWGTLIMVCGVMVLVGLMRTSGGLELIGKAVASFTNPWTAPAVLAFVAGIISIYSSTTGVVMPAFLPMVSSVLDAVGGGNLVGSISLMVLSGNVVDASPLSTLGALILASAPPAEDRERLFKHLMLWGLAMAVVGTAVGWVLYILLGL